MIDINKFFKDFAKKSLGCTEPAAIGLSVSIAWNALKGNLPLWIKERYLQTTISENRKEFKTDEINKVIVRLDKDTYRNALEAVIPYTKGIKGTQNAIALGLFCNPEHVLKLFQGLTEENISKSKKLLEKGIIEIIPEYEWDKLQVIAEIYLNDDKSMAQLSGDHSNITKINVNDKTLLDRDLDENELASPISKLIKLEIKDLLDLIKDLPMETMNLLEESLKNNYSAFEKAREMFSARDEKSVGLTIKKLIDEGYLANDIINYTKYVVTTAVEGRMVGFPIEVVTCAGSGNMGLTVTLTLKIIAECFKKDKEKLVQSLALSHLMANYVSNYSGNLSALCGCNTKAGIGLAAGISYMLIEDGLNEDEVIKIIGSAINTSIADITGIICDGAKRACSFKAATAVNSAIMCAFLALKGLQPSPDQGIINNNPLMSIKNIEIISRGMRETDNLIIKEILDRNL